MTVEETISFTSNSTISRFSQRCMRVPITPRPPQHLVVSVFNFGHSGGCVVICHYSFNLHFSSD